MVALAEEKVATLPLLADGGLASRVSAGTEGLIQ